ncbi:protein arginine N-methyltransferase 5 [Syncephalis pseudoplumigaleata]|uniref:Protein arginine N-methyltransferase n=2 Tax=Syncephalis pseudoplumigaleata TaxID=1712513 RepID=A0A4V1J2B4_9FUNG|nr:protein arginine N-methyltransferase 5 [Syncephalis pseudoplumigaleata]|eukprot:RKP27969.1 protein arginine N-methyltransferase 5 [Syncephalis pseudoplumigaleata]
MAKTVRVGIEIDAASSAELGPLIESAKQHGYDYVTTPLTNRTRQLAARLEGDAAAAVPLGLPENRAFSLDQLVLDRVDWASSVVGRHAAWADVTAKDTADYIAAEELLQRETAWATHLGLPAMILALPDLLVDVPSVARYVSQTIATASYTQLWVRASTSNEAGIQGMAAATVDEDGNWECWSLLRLLCGHAPSVALCLELTADLPDEEKLDRWLAEPIAAVVLPESVWLRNAKGYPVLSRRHQAVIHRLLSRSVEVIVRAEAPVAEAQVAHYQQYVRHLAANPPPPSHCEAFATGYQDYLQAPLQPLMDNLESSTYQVFEQDPVKYVQYEEAVYRALCDRVPDAAASETTSVIMVVGAGRGPLVTRCLEAARRANRLVRVFAIEKNPNAYVTLQKMNKEVWRERVTVVWTDMREWDTEERADILVSELLGSFGDNELSPECLDGAQKLLKEDGISIPASYTSFIAPLSSAKLHAEVAALPSPSRHETPYVVLFSAVHQMAEPQAIWTFEHPLRSSKTHALIEPRMDNKHNVRYSRNTFTLAQAAMMHGIAGYFDTVLYKDVTLSILPSTASEGMFSWFPILFPLKNPIYVPSDAIVDVHFWRRTNCKKTWYEWSVMVYEPTAPSFNVVSSRRRLIAASCIHNVNGESSWIGL